MTRHSKKLRLDQLLVKKNLVSSRERAKRLIMAGKVMVDDEVVNQAGRQFPEDTSPQLLTDPNPYVSRGGLKLDHALRTFNLIPKGKTAVDIGASTGGFTDCLLQHGTEKVYAVDVGYGQLDWKLQNDPRVTILDRQNIRYLELAKIGSPVDLAVIDVSFISLKLVIPPVTNLLKSEGDLVALVKPQFEVGKEEVENKGIIRDPQKHLNVLLRLHGFVQGRGWAIQNLTTSPITGQKGNKEFFIHCTKQRGKNISEEAIRELVLT